MNDKNITHCRNYPEKITHWMCDRNPHHIVDHVGILVKTENGCTYLIHNPGFRNGWAKIEPTTTKNMHYDGRGWCPTTRTIYDTDILKEANKTGTYSLIYNNCYHVRNNMIKYLKQNNNVSCSSC